MRDATGIKVRNGIGLGIALRQGPGRDGGGKDGSKSELHVVL